MALILFCACENKKKNFPSLKLNKVVRGMHTWEIDSTSNSRGFPYIVIEEKQIKELTPYYIDKKQKLLINRELNSLLYDLFESSDIKKIIFYNKNNIEFVFYEDSNLFRKKSLNYIYCKGECNIEGFELLNEPDWYYNETKISN